MRSRACNETQLRAPIQLKQGEMIMGRQHAADNVP